MSMSKRHVESLMQKRFALSSSSEDWEAPALRAAEPSRLLDFTGGAGNDIFMDDDEGHTLEGMGGDDFLFGWGGDDLLYGGTGNDDLFGGDGDDYIEGNDGDDQLQGNEGDDVLSGSSGEDQLEGGEGSDYLYGGESGDSLKGGIGADYLYGEAGADTLEGGAGDDTYYVDDAGDRVVEQSDEGLDTVYSSISMILSANVENLTLYDGATNGTGNELNNRLYGNTTNNILTGAAGDDYLDGRAGDDTLDGGPGNDKLDGDWGNDKLQGGAGDDLYFVGEAGDVVIEQSGEGIDAVYSNVSVTLWANVENLTLNSNAVRGTGNELNNVIREDSLNDNVLRGLGGQDTLTGSFGSDLLVGGADRDVLTGGFSRDIFDYNGVSESSGKFADIIADFVHLSDEVDLTTIDANTKLAGNQAFTFISKQEFGGAGEVRFEQFNRTGTANDTTIIEADSNGDGASDLRIVLKGLVNLTAADFEL